MKLLKKIYNHRDFYLPTWGKITLPYISPDLAQILLSDWLWAPLLYTMNGETRPLVTYEPVEFEKNPIILEESMEYTSN